MSLTHSLEESAALLGDDVKLEWLMLQLRSGRFPGRKIARKWRMTDEDIQAALDICRNTDRVTGQQSDDPVLSLTRTSQRRRTA